MTRRLDPHGIVLKAGKWYLVARDHRGMRTYRVNQILDLAVLDEHFERAEDFDLAEYWAAGISEFRAGLHQGKATIRLSPAGRDRAAALYNTETIRALRATASQPDQDGWVRAVVPIESTENAQSEFLRLGADVEILEPRRTTGPDIGCRPRPGRDLPSRPAEPSKFLESPRSAGQGLASRLRPTVTLENWRRLDPGKPRHIRALLLLRGA